MGNPKAKAFFTWFMFAVVIGCAPIVADLVIDGLQATPTGRIAAVERGDVLLIAATFTAAALGELLCAEPKTPVRAVIIGGLAVATILVDAIVYSFLHSTSALLSHDGLYTTTMIWFFTSLIAGGSSIIVAKQ